MKLDIGAGRTREEGWTSVDVDASWDPDICTTAWDLSSLTDGSVSHIRAIDVLEHIPYRMVVETLKEWRRVLQRRGQMFIQVPDFQTVAHWYTRRDDRLFERLPDDVESSPMMGVNWRLMGGQDGTYGNPDFNIHLTLFDSAFLGWCLNQAGLHHWTIYVNEHPNIQCSVVK